MKVKNKRHAKILELVRDNDIETQDELTLYLNAAGFKTTQATVSRDIKELHLVKVLTKDNVYKYEPREKASGATHAINLKSRGIMKDSLISVHPASSLVIVKCYAGMAQGACAAIDSLNKGSIVGSIAGDDTIFLATDSDVIAKELADEIHTILQQ